MARELRSWLFECLLTIGLGLAAAQIGIVAGGTRGLMVGSSSLLFALPLFTCVFVARPAGRSPLHGWLARACTAPFVALMAWWIIDHPIVHHEQCWICREDNSDLAIAAISVVGLASLVGLTSANVAARLLLRVTDAAARVRALRRGALAALAIGVLVVVAARRASVRKPDLTIADWSRSLPTLGVLRVGDESNIAIGGLTVSLAHDRILRAKRADSVIDTHAHLTTPITIRHDPARGLILLEEAYASDTRCTPRHPCRVVLRENGKRVGLYPRDFAKSTPPPTLWIASATCGLVLAAMTLFARRSPILKLRGHAFRDATHEGLGVVRLPEEVRQLSDAVVLDEGPVVVVERHDDNAYRGSHDVVTVVAGTATQLTDAIHDAEATRSARTMAIALVVTAPLIAACLCGFAP